MSEPIVAYQLSLLGDAPKPCRAWRRTFYNWSLCGMPIIDDDMQRQVRLLTAESESLVRASSSDRTRGET